MVRVITLAALLVALMSGYASAQSLTAISTPGDTNIVEGGQPLRITATLSSDARSDLTVRFVRVGGSASANDYSIPPIRLNEGDLIGRTLLTATHDDIPENSETLILQKLLGKSERAFIDRNIVGCSRGGTHRRVNYERQCGNVRSRSTFDTKC